MAASAADLGAGACDSGTIGGSAANPASVDEDNDDFADASVNGSTANRLQRGLPTEGKWEQAAVLHLGARSTLAPPDSEKRRPARRVGADVPGDRRGGLDEFAEEPAPKKARKGAGRGVGMAAPPPGAACSSEASPADVQTPGDAGGGTAFQNQSSGKRARQLFAHSGWPDLAVAHEEAAVPAGSRLKKPRQPVPYREPPLASGGGPGAEPPHGPASSSGACGLNSLPGDGEPEDDLTPEMLDGGEALGAPLEEEVAAAPKKRRHRGKKADEGDWPELKPRHLRGKRKDEADARSAHNASMSDARRAAAMLVSPPQGDQPPAAAVRGTLSRMLRPKLRRWCVYEWFDSPVRAWRHHRAPPLPRWTL